MASRSPVTPLAAAIGQVAELRLRKLVGGKKIYIPFRIRPPHWLYACVGELAAPLLEDFAGGTYLWLRRPPSDRHQRNLRIMADWRSGVAPGQLAQNYELSDRQIYRIIKAYAAAPKSLNASR